VGRKVVDADAYLGIRHVAANMCFIATGEDSAEGTTVRTVYMADSDSRATSVPWVTTIASREPNRADASPLAHRASCSCVANPDKRSQTTFMASGRPPARFLPRLGLFRWLPAEPSMQRYNNCTRLSSVTNDLQYGFGDFASRVTLPFPSIC
jgi:hypothetical protein